MPTERENELKNKVDKLQEEYNFQREYGKTLNEWIIDLDENINKNNEEIQRLKSQIASSQKEKEKSQAQLNQVKEENNRLRECKKVINLINGIWNKTEIIPREDKDNVLGSDWEEQLLNLLSVDKIHTKRDKLKSEIEARREIEENNQKNYEKEIQQKISEASGFINNSNPTKEQLEKLLSRELLGELEVIRDEWGTSSVPAKWRAYLAFTKKNKQEKGKEDVIVKIIDALKTRILAEETIEVISSTLKGDPELQGYELGSEYDDFKSKLRNMKGDGINHYENAAIKLAASIRQVRSRLDNWLKLSKEIVDNNNNDKEVEKNRENVLKFIFALEEFAESKQEVNKVIWLTYIIYQEEINQLVNRFEEGSLFKIAREQALGRLTKKRELLKGWGINVTDDTFSKYERLIKEANSAALSSRTYENQFLDEHQNFQTKIEVHPPLS